MRRFRFVLSTLLLASFAVPSINAAAAPPTSTAANNSRNQRVTLYSDGEVITVLMFYRTSSKTPQFVIHANQLEVNKTKGAHTLRLKGDVSIKRSAARAGEKGITLLADEALIEILPDQPLPITF